MRDARGTATSVWAVTRILNLFVLFRAIRSMPHFTNYGIIMGTISDGMRNLKAFIGILIVRIQNANRLDEHFSSNSPISFYAVSLLRLCRLGYVALSWCDQSSDRHRHSVRVHGRKGFIVTRRPCLEMRLVDRTNRVTTGPITSMTFL